MKEAVPRAYFPIRQSDGISTLQEYVPPHETFANGLDVERISIQDSRDPGGREDFTFDRSRIHNLLLGFRQLSSLMLEHSLQGIGHQTDDRVLVDAARSR